MSENIKEEVGPIYDERVKETLAALLEGKTREELSESMGFASWKSLDVYMRRKGFAWDSVQNLYVPSQKKSRNAKQKELFMPAKVEKVIRKIEMMGDSFDPKEVAKQLGFSSHLELAAYMQEKNFVWDSEVKNYVQCELEVLSTAVSEETEKECLNMSGNHLEALHLYLPLLRHLKENEERLRELLSESHSGTIPKYGVPGIPRTKSIYMSDSLARLLNDFGEEKNLSQREIVEAAIVEYLRKYGYEKEVDRLLSLS